MGNESKYHATEGELLDELRMVKAAQLNPAKFDALYTKYYEAILMFVYQRVDSKDAAFEITAQVFLKAMLNIQKYQFKGVPFSAWLYRIALNELNALFRKNQKIRAINVDMETVDDLIYEMEEENLEEKCQLLMDALARLPEEDLQLIEMRYFEKRPFKEIADILSITENNSKVRVYRILDKIKGILQQNN
jgi:RNA polymerase sigma-70 factor, ECF subfamily